MFGKQAEGSENSQGALLPLLVLCGLWLFFVVTFGRVTVDFKELRAQC